MSISKREQMAGTVAVAGGGIIGLSTAWRLAQQGWQVTVFDQGRAGHGASWAGAGMLAPGGEVEELSSFSVYLVEAREQYPAFVAELTSESGVAIDLQQNGALDLAYSDVEWSELQARAERQQGIGIPSKPVGVDRVRAFWPRVRVEGLAGALFYPNDAIVNSREVVTALQAACLRRGVQVVEEARVCSIAANNDKFSLCTEASETRDFSRVIVAAGAWSGAISVTGLPALPVSEPVKGHLLGYKQPLDTCSTIVRHGHTYLLQRANGLLIAGASVERVGFNAAIDDDIVHCLIHQAGEALPHLLETTPTEVWTGFRPGADALYVGPWHSRRFYLAYGHYRNGILLAPWTAQRLSEQLGAPDLD